MTVCSLPTTLTLGKAGGVSGLPHSLCSTAVPDTPMGYDIDVRAPEPPPESTPDDENGTEEPSADELARASFQHQIRELSPRLRAERPRGASILALPEAIDDSSPSQ